MDGPMPVCNGPAPVCNGPVCYGQLTNIIDSIELPNVFTPNEELEIIETAYSLILELLYTEPMLYIHANFHKHVLYEVTELLSEQFASTISYDICDEISSCVEQAMKLFYTLIAPKRSFKNTFIRNASKKLINKQRIKDKITYLQNIIQPEQRTTEWYNFRYKYLTASSIWKAFISESTRNQLIFDKCKPLNLEKYNHTSTDSPMHWGHKYEPVSIKLYEMLFQTKVSDFGCIPHKTTAFLAASPDGINTLESSERYGRMLEVKNIVNRVIDGIPKMEYWIQMQLQMEVCNLNECDFLETRFKEYLDEEEFLKDSYDVTNICKTKDNKQKGVIMQFIVNGQPHYEYAQLNANSQQMATWEETMMEKHATDMWIKHIYWRLDELSCVLVLRNKFWFNRAIPVLIELWETIEYEKINGYQHRMPKKKIKLNDNKSSIVTESKCCIESLEEFNINTDMLCDIIG
jgi:putative phage-type endonuclease